MRRLAQSKKGFSKSVTPRKTFMTLYLPSHYTAHFILTITIALPYQYDGRGRSDSKTAQLIDQVKSLLNLKIVSQLWGSHAYFAKLIEFHAESLSEIGQNLLKITVAAPPTFNQDGLAKCINTALYEILNLAPKAYIQCYRQYSEDEAREQGWL